jgi:hypothetical protein
MNADVAKAHIGALTDWSDQYERDGQEGAASVAFELRRAARLIARMHGLPLPTPEPPVAETPADEPRDDETVKQG